MGALSERKLQALDEEEPDVTHAVAKPGQTGAGAREPRRPSLMESITPASLAAAMPDLTLGAVCLLTWIAADRMPAWILGYIVVTMLLEFIVIHSSAVLGTTAFSPAPLKQKTRGILGLSLLYTMFALGFSLAFKTLWPLVSFWAQTANRLAGVMLGNGVSERQKHYIQGMWGACAMLYLGGAFATSFLPLPRGGVTYEVVNAANLPGEGLWIDEPWRVLAFGFVYFTGVGLFDLFQERWVPFMKQVKPVRR